jgi:integrase
MNTHRQRTDYLWFRPNTSLIWFSRAVPKEHVGAEGRKQIQFSLKTADRKEAAAKARRIASEQDARWGLYQPDEHDPASRKVPSVEELEEAAVVAAYEFEVAVADEGRRNLRGKGPVMWQGHRNWVRRDLDEQARMTATHDYSNVETIAQQVIEAAGFDIAPGDAAYERLCDMLNKQLLNAMKVNVERTDGNVDFEAPDPVVRRVREREKARAAAGETIMELFERWAKDQLDRGEKRPDTVEQDRKVIRQFAEFVGQDRSITTITPKDMAEYRDILRSLPPKWRSNKKIAHLPIREAAEQARALGLAQSAYTSVNKHLSTISPLYKWLAADPRWAGLRNPCDGLFHKKVRGRNRRPSFTTAQLNGMLKSPLFTGFAVDGKEWERGERLADDWRKWIPLVCMFTGARIGEIAQLRLRDVTQERGVWFIHIRHDEAAQQSTKSGKSRPAAIHAQLVKIGFIDYVNSRREAAGDESAVLLFPEMKPDARGQIGAGASRWWRKYLTKIGIKDGRDGVGAHAFRHTLADRLRSEAELLDNQIAVCLGHSQTSTTGGYGQLSQGTITMLKGWIDSVRFDGVDFSHLHARGSPNGSVSSDE